MITIIVTAVILFFTLPFFIKVNFSFNSIKNSLFIKIYLYGFRVLTIRAALGDSFVYSMGKSIKTLDIKLQKPKIKMLLKPKKDSLAIEVKTTLIYGKKDDPMATSMTCVALDNIFSMLDKSIDMINSRIRITPSYNSEILCVRSHLKVVTNPLKIFLMLL